MLKSIKNLKWGYVLIALLLGAVGVCFILFDDSVKMLTITIGIIATVFGAALGILTVASKKRGASFALKIIVAIVCLASGIVTIIFNREAVEIIISVFCLLLIIDGSFKLNTSIVSKRHSVAAWWIIAAVAAAVIVCSFVLARYPQKFAAPTLFLGIVIVLDAIINLLSTVWVSRCETAAKAELYYEVHKDFERIGKK